MVEKLDTKLFGNGALYVCTVAAISGGVALALVIACDLYIEAISGSTRGILRPLIDEVGRSMLIGCGFAIGGLTAFFCHAVVWLLTHPGPRPGEGSPPAAAP